MAGEPINDDLPLMRAAELLEDAGTPPSYPREMCQELRRRIEFGLAGLPPSPIGLVVTGSDLGERAALGSSCLPVRAVVPKDATADVTLVEKAAKLVGTIVVAWVGLPPEGGDLGILLDLRPAESHCRDAARVAKSCLDVLRGQ